MLSGIFNFLSVGGMKSIENIASEWIETSQEEAEAKVVMIKALDPNGIMRRNLSTFACRAYGFFLLMAVVLIICHSFGFTEKEQAAEALTALSELFLPITTAWGSIVAASFGVNYSNVKQNK